MQTRTRRILAVRDQGDRPASLRRAGAFATVGVLVAASMVAGVGAAGAATAPDEIAASAGATGNQARGGVENQADDIDDPGDDNPGVNRDLTLTSPVTGDLGPSPHWSRQFDYEARGVDLDEPEGDITFTGTVAPWLLPQADVIEVVAVTATGSYAATTSVDGEGGWTLTTGPDDHDVDPDTGAISTKITLLMYGSPLAAARWVGHDITWGSADVDPDAPTVAITSVTSEFPDDGGHWTDERIIVSGTAETFDGSTPTVTAWFEEYAVPRSIEADADGTWAIEFGPREWDGAWTAIAKAVDGLDRMSPRTRFTSIDVQQYVAPRLTLDVPSRVDEGGDVQVTATVTQGSFAVDEVGFVLTDGDGHEVGRAGEPVVGSSSSAVFEALPAGRYTVTATATDTSGHTANPSRTVTETGTFAVTGEAPAPTGSGAPTDPTDPSSPGSTTDEPSSGTDDTATDGTSVTAGTADENVAVDDAETEAGTSAVATTGTPSGLAETGTGARSMAALAGGVLGAGVLAVLLAALIRRRREEEDGA